MPFLPTNRNEMEQRGWDQLDVIFVTGDAYVDHPSFGVPLLARLLESYGFRVGIIAQPDWRSTEAFTLLGRPRLFFGISAGAMDSMVAHYTPARKLRYDDAYTPGNRHGARPNRASIVYASRVREAFRDVPVVLGGIEASLRRFAHYDFWEDKVRRSLIFDAKADLLVYGMGERPLLEVAQRLKRGEALIALKDVRGTAFIAGQAPGAGTSETVTLPSFEEVEADTEKFAEAFRLFSREANPWQGRRILQPHGNRMLVCNPPSLPLSEQELDGLYLLPFTRLPHPLYREPITAHEQIKNSITTHRGCYGGCAFCAITHHQGKTIQSRSVESIMQEVDRLAEQKWFRGTVTDLGGPTANMYGTGCSNSDAEKNCRRASCLYPQRCIKLLHSGEGAVRMLRRVRSNRKIKTAYIASGVRHDLLLQQPQYFRELVAHHVGGLLKVAPEHLVNSVLAVMHKPGRAEFLHFIDSFREGSAAAGKKQHIVPYLMSGHPGCTLNDMIDLSVQLKKNGLKVEQVQDFTPTPGTLSTCMYYTGQDPFTGKPVHVPRTDKEKRLQKSLLLYHLPAERKNMHEALLICGRGDVEALLLPMRGSGRIVGDLSRKRKRP